MVNGCNWRNLDGVTAHLHPLARIEEVNVTSHANLFCFFLFHAAPYMNNSLRPSTLKMAAIKGSSEAHS